MRLIAFEGEVLVAEAEDVLDRGVEAHAREGARLAALPDATNTSVETAVLDFVEASVGVPRSKVTVTISVTPAAGNPNPADVLANARKRDLCNIKVDVGFADVDYLPGKFLADRKLMGQCAMRRE